MLHRLRKEIPFLGLLCLIVASPALVARPVAPEKSEVVAATREHISEARAGAVARKASPAGELLACRLENEDGRVLYEATLVERHRQREILVDAYDGRILADRYGASR